MKKRVLSLALALALLLSLVSGVQFSALGAGSYSKATSISVGETVILVCSDASMELSGISTTNTKYGVGTAYTTFPGGLMLLEVCEGSSAGTYAFKNGDKYLYWGSGNTLNANATLSANTSWEVSFDTEGNATILNSADPGRQILWNVGSPRFAAYTDKTVGNSYYNVQLYKAPTGTCVHGNTGYVVLSAPTCTETGTWKYTCKDCGYSWTATVKATGHTYGFTVINGSIYNACIDCGDGMEVTVHTIAEAKAFTDTATVYNVRGVVTYIKGRTVYIEDSNDGLCVYFDSSVDLSTLKPGDEIFVSSTMTTYKNLPELNNPDEFLRLSSGNSLPNTTDLTIGQILEDTAFAHLGKRVTLKNLTIGTINPAGYTAITDASGNSISIFSVPTLDSSIQAGNKVNVTAIISYFDDGFQLLVNPPTALTDVVKVGEGSSVEVQTVPIATAKAGGDEVYYQVEGIVTCMKGRQIFIQDDTGGIVVYLASMPTEAPCAVGDMIRVYGSFGNYDGVLELQYVDHTNPDFFKVLSSENKVVAQPVTIEGLLYDSAIDYDLFAEKVFLDDVSILEIDTDGSVLLWQDDYTIMIYAAPALNEGCQVGAVVDVTATVSGYNFNYELVIVDADAIHYGSDCLHEETMAVNVMAPTCTTTGYTGDFYCTVCGEYLYSGEILPEAHSTIMVNSVEATCETAGHTGEAYCELCHTVLDSGSVIPPLGHDLAAQSVIPPTCTENGYTSYTCNRCGVDYEGDFVGATGHTCTYRDNGETHSYTCSVCGAQGTEEHAYDDGFCSLCGGAAPADTVPVDETIVIRHSLNLASDISINFAVSVASLEGYENFYLECTRNVYDGNEIVGEESIFIDMPTLNGSYYYFTLSGINATQMGDMISATLYMSKGDKIYCSTEDVYCVADYAYSQLNKTGASVTLKTLCADLLQYGAAAQSYKSYRTDSLVDEAMTDEHRAFMTGLNAVTFGNHNAQMGDLTAPTVTWKGKSLVMDSKITIRFVVDTTGYTGNVDDLQLRVSYLDYSGNTVNAVVEHADMYNASANWYSFDFDGLLAAELRTVVSAAVYAGDTRISETLQYSADTYGNNKTGTLLAVCKAMVAYSDSAMAYFVG